MGEGRAMCVVKSFRLLKMSWSLCLLLESLAISGFNARQLNFDSNDFNLVPGHVGSHV